MQRVRSFLVVAVVLVAGWLPVAGPAAGAAQTEPPPLDLPSLAIYPSDTGADGYVILDARTCLTPKACADPVFFGSPSEATLTEAGLTRAYAIALAAFGPDGTFPPQRTVATTIAQYETKSGANAGLDTFLSWLADPAAEVNVSRRIGDESEMFDLPASPPFDNAATGVIGLRFRTGTFVVGVEVREYTGGEPDRDYVEQLARLVAARIAEEPVAPGLDTLIVHHRAIATEFYVHRNGETIPLYQESADQFAARAAEFADAGIQDVFLSNQTLVAGDEPRQIDVLLSVAMYRLSSPAAASNYLNTASTAFAVSRERSGAPISELEEPPIVGDESVWYLNVFSDAYQAMVYVRVGNVVARIIWQQNLATPEPASPDKLVNAEEELLPGAQYTAEQQVLCLENGGCPGVTRLSSRLLP